MVTPRTQKECHVWLFCSLHQVASSLRPLRRFLLLTASLARRRVQLYKSTPPPRHLSMLTAPVPAHWRPSVHRARPVPCSRIDGTKVPRRRRLLIITGHIGLGWSGRATGLAAHPAIIRSHAGHVVIALALATRVVAATLQFRIMF
jgi:hypothetical protein